MVIMKKSMAYCIPTGFNSEPEFYIPWKSYTVGRYVHTKVVEFGGKVEEKYSKFFFFISWNGKCG